MNNDAHVADACGPKRLFTTCNPLIDVHELVETTFGSFVDAGKALTRARFERQCFRHRAGVCHVAFPYQLLQERALMSSVSCDLAGARIIFKRAPLKVGWL